MGHAALKTKGYEEFWPGCGVCTAAPGTREEGAGGTGAGNDAQDHLGCHQPQGPAGSSRGLMPGQDKCHKISALLTLCSPQMPGHALHLISIFFLNLLFCDLTYDLYQRIFHVHFRRLCILLLLGGMLFICLLDPVDL